MIKIYQYSSDGIATGTSVEQSKEKPIPVGWTHKTPSGVEGERFVGGIWQVAIISELPVQEDDFTYKTDIWQRCSDDEAERLDAALEQAPAKERRMWNDAITIEHSSDYYATLFEQMSNQFGEERTKEILAPSDPEGIGGVR